VKQVKKFRGMSQSIEEMSLIKDVFDENSSLLWTLCGDKKVRVYKALGGMNEIKNETMESLSFDLNFEDYDIKTVETEHFEDKTENRDDLIESYENEIENLRVQLQNAVNGMNRYKNQNQKTITSEVQTDLSSSQMDREKENLDIFKLEMVNYQNDLDQASRAFHFLINDLKHVKSEKEEMIGLLDFKENEIQTLRKIISSIEDEDENKEEIHQLLIEQSNNNLFQKKKLDLIELENQKLIKENEELIKQSSQIKEYVRLLSSNLNISIEDKNETEMLKDIHLKIHQEKNETNSQIQNLFKKFEMMMESK
jgi:hypothetical protein